MLILYHVADPGQDHLLHYLRSPPGFLGGISFATSGWSRDLKLPGL